jgi:CheY-like chemotaxis protein
LQRIIQQGQRAATLIRQILDFSRQSVTEKRPIDLAAFLKETIKLLERTISEDIRIVLEIEPNSYNAYTLNGDPTQIQQVLANLAVNARDAMPVGGVMQFRLTHFTLNPDEQPPYPEMSPGPWMLLSVSDTGVGISPEALPRIFEPFFTTKDVGKGTGLGLAQVFGIITQHEGYIDVQTEFGKGTKFIIYLPAMSLLSKTTLQTAETETSEGHGELILLVEDDVAVLEVTRVMIENLGYRVITAANGRQALEAYDDYHPEIALVLTDITMPEMGGVTLAQSLQAKYPAVKVIALTGYPLEAGSKESMDQGVIDWLQKPLNRHQLAQTLRQSLTIEPRNAVRSADR